MNASQKSLQDLTNAYAALHAAAKTGKDTLPALRRAVHAAQWAVWEETKRVDDLPYYMKAD